MDNDFFVMANVLPGKLNALVKNIMRQTGVNDPNEAVRMVNAGKAQILVVKPKWTEKNYIISFFVISYGLTGEEWIARLESKGFCVGDYAKRVLRSKSFKPTSGVIYKIAVLKGELFNDNERITKNIRKKAEDYKFSTPNAEVACLIREKFTDKELEAMGLHSIITMHEPIKDSDDNPKLLGACCGYYDPWLGTGYGNPDFKWGDCSGGFAFVVSQIIS